MADFAKLMQQERDRIEAAIADIVKQQEALDEKLVALSREREAIDAYEKAKSGKLPKKSQPRGERRTGVREAVLQIIRSSPTGIKAGDVVKALNSDGDKKYTTAIYQALAALKRDKKVDNKDGQYVTL